MVDFLLVPYTMYFKIQFFVPWESIPRGTLEASRAETHSGQIIFLLSILYMKRVKNYEVSTLYECVEQLLMSIGCNSWMICLELNWSFYDPSWMSQLSEFVLTLRSSLWVGLNNFLLIDATDKSKISGDNHR